MTGEWCYFKSYFDKNTCEEILKISQTIKWEKGKTGLHGGGNDGGRRSEVKFLQNDNNFSFLFDTLWKTALRANKDFFNFHISKLDFIQLAEYCSSNLGEYSNHHDVFWITNEPYFHRKLSCIVQLTDPSEYEGGDLELLDINTFPNPNEIRLQGTVIFFPSFTYHRATKVTKGVRHSLAAWFEGPKWR